MIEHIEKRALALLLAVLLVFSMVPMQASAYDNRTETASMGNLGISVSIPTVNGGSADLGSFNLTGNTIVATAQAESNTDDCTGITTYNATQTIITFTNNASGEAMIRFDFNINGGKLEVNGDEQATSGNYATGAIAAGGTLEVKLYSPSSGSNKVGDSGSLTLTNLEIIENNTVNVVFKPGTNGTVKVKGTAISADTTVTTTYVEGVAVTATPASGYKFIAWVDETNNVVSAAANTTLHLSQSATVSAYFVPTSTNGYWLAGSKIHTDLENAIAAAQAADGMVRLLDSTTLTKSVTIPAGVAVVIPCDTDMIFYGENPVALARSNGTLPTPTAFRTLTMADGVVLTVYGSLEASARHYVAHGGKYDGGRVIDKYGFIKMNTNSRIDVQSGGKLFAWGYISGSGKVNAYSGATVYEKFQIADYRGGGITSIIVPSGVFPFNQYYVQNVEVPETIHGGATLICNAGIYGSEVMVSNLEFIGTNGMFNVSAGSTATKRYDAASDRLVIDVDGQVSLNPISLMDYNTANFVLPINHNITVNINSGITTVNQDLLLQPGAEVNVDRDAYLALASGKKVYLMDVDNWGNYCFGATMRPIYYTVANGTTVKRTTLSDAKVNLNGTAAIQGQLYASAAGAQVVSTGKTGVIVLMNSAPSGTTNIKQSTITSSSQVMSATTNIKVGAALLTNADTTTVSTQGAKQYTTYVYDSVLDKWVTTAISIAPTLTYNANGGNGEDRPLTINFQNTALSYQPLSQVVDGAGTFTREGAVFTGWNTAADGSGKAFAPGDFITISQNTTLFAQWRNTSATVSFAANAPEGTTAQGQMNSQTLILDESGNSEFEVPACGYTVDGYTFDGWLGSDGNYYVVGQVYTVSGDLTLTAQWTKSSVVITFNANAPAGTTASGAMADQFAMEGDKLSTNAFAVTGYTFVGWNTKADGSGTAYADAATAPTVNTTLYAQWKINTYTITWIIDGKSETTTVNHGQVPTHADPTKAATAEYTYEFTGWTPAVVAATGNATYTAQFKEIPNSYTITYKVDGVEVQKDTYAYGAAVTAWNYTAAEGYNFSGWNAEIPATMPAENLTFTGTTSIKTYTITWIIEGKSETTTVNHGQVPTHADPTKAATAEYTYEFTGWTPAVVAATGNATYTAQFKATAKTYTVTLMVDGVQYGEVLTFAYGANVNLPAPTKADNGCTSYTFAGWNESVPATMPAKNLTFNAKFTAKTEHNYATEVEGTRVDATCVKTGSVTMKCECGVTKDVTLEINSDAHDWREAGYTINGETHTLNYRCQHNSAHIKSDPAVPHTYVNGVCVCNATKNYTITWSVNGVTTNTIVKHGVTPTAPAADKNDTAEWDYTFSHWEDADGNEYTTIPAATADVTYTAVFTSEKQTYTITWKDDLGNVIDTTSVEYGTVPSHAAPSKAATAEYSFNFTGWTPAVTAVTGNAAYTAQFDAVPNTYKVIYMVNGEQIHEDSFAFGANVTAWAGYTAPEGYTFDGWGNVPATMPAEDVTVTGTITIKSYTITWIIDGKSETTTVKHGETPAYEGTPTKESTAQFDYTFAGWGNVVSATGDATYTATFTPVLRRYNITFVVDGVETKVSTNYGEKPVFADPTKTTDAYYSYEFAGWTPEVVAVTGEATYTATWNKTPVEHSITFVIDGVEGIFYQVKGGYGTAVTYDVPSTDKTGYTFNGWDQQLPATFPGVDTTITGSYTVNQYTITFKGDFNIDKDDAFADYTITKNYGETITAADITALNEMLPTITGWEFLGWFYAEEVESEGDKVWEHTDEYEIPETMGAEDVTVYALWDMITYELTVKSSIDDTPIDYNYMFYEEVYVDVNEFNDINHFHYTQAENESCWCEDSVLTPDGYIFAGYKYADGSEMTFPIECWPAEEVTIIAQFVPIEYTITFMSEGVMVGKITAPYGSDITAQVAQIVATKEGYHFSCWMNNGKCVTLTTMPLNGMTAEASFTVNEYLVNFFASEDDITAYASIKIEYGTELKVENLLAQITGTPEKTGHTFAGWNTSAVPTKMPAESVNVYGTWTVNSYQVVWTIDGESYDTTTVAYGEPITAPETPVKEGFTFSGWSEYPATMPAEDVTVTGSWNVNSYTITFDTDGGKETIDSITADYGTAIIWPVDPTKTGNTFLGWDMNGDGQADTLPTSMPEGGLNLKAVWAKNTVYITFVIDGVENTEEYKYGDAITAPEATKVSDAKWTYKFTGWDKELPVTAIENATYTAQFEQDEPVKYTVKFVDGENTVYKTEIAWNGEVTLDGFEAPTMEGNTLRWTVDGADVTFPYTMDTKEVTFVANWTPNTYTITADGVEYPFTYGTAVSIADPAAKEGHTFTGWLKDGVVYTLPATMPAENIVITSGWTVNTYTVRWFNNGEFFVETYEYGATVNGFIPEREYIDSETQLGWFDFAFWFDMATNEEVTLPFTMPAQNMDIAAATIYNGWNERPGSENASYYFKGNIVKDSWFCVNDQAELVTDGSGTKYYANAEGYIAYDITEIDGSYYAFDHETGKFMSSYTGIYTASNDDMYYVENGVAVADKGLVKITEADGHIHYYYFGCEDASCDEASCAGDYKAQKANSHWAEITNGYLVKWGYTFDEKGVIIHDEDTSKNGIHLDNGVKYYYIDGVKVHYGLFIGDDGGYYYARSDGSLVINRDYWISESHLNGVKHNGLLVEEGNYTFDAEGRIVWPTILKNGVYAEDGGLYYYESGVRTYAGLISYTGSLTAEDGTVTENVYADHLIYVCGTGRLALGAYWPTKNNGVLPSATYNFDEYGRMIRTNGLVKEADGIYYYVNGNRYHAGLIKVDGDFYYIRSNGQAVTGCKYWITHTNGYDVKEGSYEFTADGKMIIPEPEVLKNGIVAENGKLYYYVNGKLNYAGLIRYSGSITTEDGTVIENAYEDAWIYVRGTGELVVSRSYWVTKHNDLLEKSATFQFDENGVMQNAPV